MREREPPYTGAAVLVALGIGAGAVAYFSAEPYGLSKLSMYAGCGAPLLVFAGLAVLMHHFREEREARYGEHLQDAVSLDELVLHRVSFALPARLASELVGDVEPGRAHRLFDPIDGHLQPGVGFAHVVERLGRDVDADDVLDRAARALEGRARVDTAASYRDEPRASVARGGDDGLVVVSVLVVAHPTRTAPRAVRSVADARALRDAILPVAPEHTRAARLVLTPADGPTFDAATLRSAFPELDALTMMSLGNADSARRSARPAG